MVKTLLQMPVYIPKSALIHAANNGRVDILKLLSNHTLYHLTHTDLYPAARKCYVQVLEWYRLRYGLEIKDCRIRIHRHRRSDEKAKYRFWKILISYKKFYLESWDSGGNEVWDWIKQWRPMGMGF